MYHKKVERRQHILALMSRINQSRCDTAPVYGSDTRHCVDCMQALDTSNSYPASPCPSLSASITSSDSWRGRGHVNCLLGQNRQLNHNHPDVFWRESTHLQQLVHSPGEWLDQLKDTLSRLVVFNRNLF